jgi:formylglycine-generating enzyme
VDIKYRQTCRQQRVLQYWGRSNTHQHWFAVGLRFGQKFFNVADEDLKKNFPKWEIFNGYSDGFIFNAPVGSFPANDFGLYDMTGNVWEWCSDWKGEYNKSEGKNPVGVPLGTRKVIRGGGWLGSPEACRVADRYSDTPDHRGHSMGFRVAMTITEMKKSKK